MSRKTSTPEEQFFQRACELVEREDWDGLAEACEAHLIIDEDCGEAYFLLALSAFTRSDFATAVTYGRAAVDVAPDNMEFSDLLAVLYGLAGDIHNATFYAKLASTGKSSDKVKAWLPESLPRFTSSFFEMAERPFFTRALGDSAQGNWGNAEHWFRQHLAFHPRDAEANAALGTTLMIQGLHVPAMESLRAARHVLPKDARIAQLLAAALAALGQFPEAHAVDRSAVAEAPDDPTILAGAIGNLLADPDGAVETIAATTREWGERFGMAQDMAPPVREPALKRRLTVGYLVGAVDRSSSARALAEILARHDADAFRVIGFGSGQLSDSFNIVFQKCFETWVDTQDTDPLTFASIAAAEGVDILVDVSGFATPTLLTALGARLAPLQLSWDGCPYGTGLANMDGVLTDAVMDPDDSVAELMVENLVRLDNGAVFAELPLPKAVGDVERDDRPVFAADVTLAELDMTTVETWVGLLKAVPEAALILYDRGFHNEHALPRLIGAFGNFGLAHRVDIVSGIEMNDFLAQADVFLLPRFTARTAAVMEALSAGLPVVAWAGSGRHRRVIDSLLHYSGLADEALAESAEAYKEIALRWIGDLQGRKEFADGIAARLAAAPLLDAGNRAADLEKAYLDLWRDICPDDRSEKQDV